MEDIEALQEIPLFSAMDAQEIASVYALMDRQTYAPGQVIMRQGESGDYFYVIVQGEVQFSVQDAGGRELVIDEVGVGGFFGELSMLTGEPRSARVKSIGEVVTLALDRTEFFNFLQRQPHAAIDVLTVLGQRLHRTDSLLRQSVSRNVNELVEEQSTLTQRIADAIADLAAACLFDW
ncbi:MAG: cyclic nucleotide-binding domain-containing protein [Anaerolineae bacterium]